MASEPFNSLGGYTVGIPAKSVVDSNGNVISNFLNLTGNVAAGAIYSNNYRYANGQPFAPGPSGANTQLLFNNNGTISGIPNVTWNGDILSLGNISNLSIGGGDNGYFLQTDGTGNLSWAAGGNGGTGSPCVSNTQIQYNDAGVFGGSSGFTFDKTTSILTVSNIAASNATFSNTVVINSNLTVNTSAVLTIAGNINSISSPNVSLGNVENIHITGGLSGYVLATDGSGNLSWTAGGSGSPGGTNQNVQFNNAGAFGGVAAFTFNSSTGLLTVPSIKSNTTANFQGASSVNLGNVANLHIGGGIDGYVLQTDGAGTLAWAAGGGGGGSPGGSNTQIQFNNMGTFGGTPYLTYNDSTKTVNVAGNLIANTFQMGSGIYQFCTSSVYFATTVSTAPDQVLWSAPIDVLSAVDFTIISTDVTNGTRQTAKISATFYNGVVAYNEYAGLQINGGVGSFSVAYDAGGVINPPSVQLLITPDSASQTIYKMLIIEYTV